MRRANPSISAGNLCRHCGHLDPLASTSTPRHPCLLYLHKAPTILTRNSSPDVTSLRRRLVQNINKVSSKKNASRLISPRREYGPAAAVLFCVWKKFICRAKTKSTPSDYIYLTLGHLSSLLAPRLLSYPSHNSGTFCIRQQVLSRIRCKSRAPSACPFRALIQRSRTTPFVPATSHGTIADITNGMHDLSTSLGCVIHRPALS